eukprot:364440-Chlamydomonas_euryale.AAC.6
MHRLRGSMLVKFHHAVLSCSRSWAQHGAADMTLLGMWTLRTHSHIQSGTTVAAMTPALERLHASMPLPRACYRTEVLSVAVHVRNKTCSFRVGAIANRAVAASNHRPEDGCMSSVGV